MILHLLSSRGKSIYTKPHQQQGVSVGWNAISKLGSLGSCMKYALGLEGEGDDARGEGRGGRGAGVADGARVVVVGRGDLLVGVGAARERHRQRARALLPVPRKLALQGCNSIRPAECVTLRSYSLCPINWAAPPTEIGQMMHCGYIIALPSLSPMSLLLATATVFIRAIFARYSVIHLPQSDE